MLTESTTYPVTSVKDKTRLMLRHWPCNTPQAVMSLVHGLGEHSGRYDSLAPDLVEAGIAVVAIDLRGHGQSDGKRGVCNDYSLLHSDCETLLREARRIYPDVPHILYGHSLGGGLVMDYTLTASPDVAAVITSAPFIDMPKPPPAIIGWIAKIMRRLAPEATISQPLTGDKISTIKAEQDRYLNDPLNHNSINFGLASDAVAAGKRVAAGATKWARPLLLLHARGDQLTSFAASETFAGHANNVIFKAYDDSEHEMHHDKPREDVVREMINFIHSHAKSS